MAVPVSRASTATVDRLEDGRHARLRPPRKEPSRCLSVSRTASVFGPHVLFFGSVVHQVSYPILRRPDRREESPWSSFGWRVRGSAPLAPRLSASGCRARVRVLSDSVAYWLLPAAFGCIRSRRALAFAWAGRVCRRGLPTCTPLCVVRGGFCGRGWKCSACHLRPLGRDRCSVGRRVNRGLRHSLAVERARRVRRRWALMVQALHGCFACTSRCGIHVRWVAVQVPARPGCFGWPPDAA